MTFLLQRLVFEFQLCLRFRSPVTHKMAPWVQRLFIEFLPRVLCMQRPKKEEPNEADEQPSEVLTDAFHDAPEVEKYGFCGKRYSTDYGIPGMFGVGIQ
jgi:nicotinic acetylcholine receptor, invertebrate